MAIKFDAVTTNTPYMTLIEYDNYIIINGMVYDKKNLNLITNKKAVLNWSNVIRSPAIVYSNKVLSQYTMAGASKSLSSTSMMANINLLASDFIAGDSFQGTNSYGEVIFDKEGNLIFNASRIDPYCFQVFHYYLKDNPSVGFNSRGSNCGHESHFPGGYVTHGTTNQYLGRSLDNRRIFFTTQYFPGTFRVSYYDLINNTLTHLSSTPPPYDTNNYNIVASSLVIGTENQDVRTFYFARPASTSTYQVMKVDVNTSNNSVTYTPCIVGTGYSISIPNTDCATCHYTTILTTYNNNLYITAYRANYPGYNTVQPVTWTVGSDQITLSFLTQLNLKNDLADYISLDHPYNTDLIIATYNNGVYRIRFNGSSWDVEKLIDTGISNGGMLFDEYRRLWIIANNSLYLYYPDVTERVDLRTQSNSLTYTGSQINDNILLSVYRNGVRVVVSGTLKIISDNATFIDNTTQKTVTTSDTGDISIPITIKKPGVLRIEFIGG